MNDYLRSIILGVIEGFSEFLPISSTGHMILAQPLLDVDKTQPPWSTLLWVSQLGAIAAVVEFTWRDLWRRTFHARRPGWAQHIVTKLTLAMVPTIGLALLLHDYAERYLENPPMVAVGLLLGAAAMWYIDRRFRGGGTMEIEDVTLRQAFWIGVIQCLSMWSGISRAAATILGGMALGLTPRVATEFSFYLAIPTMLAASIMTLWNEQDGLTADHLAVVLTGTMAAFVVARLVVAGFLRFVRTHRFTAFVVYRVVLGLLVLAWYWAENRGLL